MAQNLINRNTFPPSNPTPTPTITTTTITSSSNRSNNNNNSSSSISSSKRTLNQLAYITFLVVLCLGELTRIYVYEHRGTKIGEGTKSETSKNGVVVDSLQRFQSHSKKKLEFGGVKARGKDDEAPHYHTLQCEAYGGPSIKDAQEMVYWKDIPSDSHYVSPFHVKKTASSLQQYMTFEPDGGGWNNIRMAMETVVGLAIATGRTLVLPPEQRFYLLGQGRGGNVKTDFSFMDFFPMQELANDNDGLTIISMEEFLTTVAMKGQLRDTHTGLVTYPPENRTNWNGVDVKPLKEYLRNSTFTPIWSPDQCLAVFPATSTMEDQNKLQRMFETIQGQKPPPQIQYPIPVNSSTLERMQESLVHRKGLCMYDHEMQQATVLHFMCYHKMRIRMLVHFYAFLFFEDYREDLWMKRFMRDHMRYIDELQCAAARIVKAIRDHVRQRSGNKKNNINGDFDTFHIRRGDFQYKATRIDAQQIYNNVKDVLVEGSTIYIATDERDKNFFKVLREHYDVLFMDDFLPQLEGVNKNHYGMIDQLVASRGRIFFGCWHSTFTGFITRMRGYHSVRDELPGHDDGTLPNTYYYVPTTQRNVMHKYSQLYGPFFNREFPTSWRQIDFGLDVNV